MEGIIVKSESPDDIRAIEVVNLSAFQGEKEAILIDELRKSQGFSQDLSLVAEFNGRIVGHLMLTPVVLKTTSGEINMLALAPMSVVPSQSHRGIGSELVNTAIERAREKGYAGIIVAGHPDYYQRFGFEAASKYGISCNLPVPEDSIMVIEVTGGSLQKGSLHYPPQFNSIY
jgi:putative acetyltransferase